MKTRKTISIWKHNKKPKGYNNKKRIGLEVSPPHLITPSITDRLFPWSSQSHYISSLHMRNYKENSHFGAVLFLFLRWFLWYWLGFFFTPPLLLLLLLLPSAGAVVLYKSRENKIKNKLGREWVREKKNPELTKVFSSLVKIKRAPLALIFASFSHWK